MVRLAGRELPTMRKGSIWEKKWMVESKFAKQRRRGSTRLELTIAAMAIVSTLWGWRRVEGRGEMLRIRAVGRAMTYHGCNGDELGIDGRRAQSERV